MLPDGPLRRDIHRVLDFRASTKVSGYKPKAVDHRRVFSAALYEITSEHVSSICLLLLYSRLSSAPALLRSCIESAARGTWLLLVATDDAVDNIVAERGKDKGWPGLEQIIGAIEGHHKAGGLLRRIFTQTGSLNDFSHGGLMQIAQRMAPHIGQDQGPIVNRVCLRNAVNALALVTCALHLEANDVAALGKVIASSFEVFSSFETAGDGKDD
jgi:hypothetical protein